MKLKWFETVKYKIVPTKLLSYFSEVNCAREVKAAKEVTRGNTKAISLSKYQFGVRKQKKKKVHYKIQRKSIRVVDEGKLISLRREPPSHPPPRCLGTPC